MFLYKTSDKTLRKNYLMGNPDFSI